MKFTHDCTLCVPLGEYDGCDLYFCELGGDPTVIARFGNRGEDYHSGMASAYIPQLEEAMRLARERGLIAPVPPRSVTFEEFGDALAAGVRRKEATP